MIKGLYEAHLPVSDLTKSIDFYTNLGLELAHKGESVTFFWIEKGKSWLGLWETERVETPYHPSLRHVAFQVELHDIQIAKKWLEERGVQVRETFGFKPEDQPLVLPNHPQSHAAIYFHDPDGNSLEFITPLILDEEIDFSMMELEEWYKRF
ncbi:VOC family protein [Piscibacillus halophilus]|uniref:Glyoxalase/Bleomycin resistance protein/Dioxygenase superfamily protein n=1 Tax=Piscibacillus halophilus TaxID=571933 RepID=A0A1H9B0G7_9BACI|nr:VOC family protein [Piscibacillus halophilus]SEP82237.1 Glyoxalase/Bleomycin resistance protein/Dioxygenase superfamily protein [Piscibacillus halophilus]